VPQRRAPPTPGSNCRKWLRAIWCPSPKDAPGRPVWASRYGLLWMAGPAQEGPPSWWRWRRLSFDQLTERTVKRDRATHGGDHLKANPRPCTLVRNRSGNCGHGVKMGFV
jgi:hypothetical protein